MKRRTFLQAGTAGLMGAAAERLHAKEPDIRFPADPRERLAIASYPFRDYIQHRRAKPQADGQALMPLTEFPAMVVKRFRVKNIEPLSDHFASREPAYLSQLRSAAGKAGVRIVNIPFSPEGSLCDPDREKRARAVADAKRWVDAAVAVGSPSVRAHIEGVKGAKPDLELTADSLKSLAAYSAEKQIVVNLENDDPKSEEAGFLVKAIEQVGSPWLRALPDFCNSMLIGNDDYNYSSVRAMFRHAYNISHVKDSEVDGSKVYRVDVARTFQIAKESGYRGFYSMEWEGQADPYTGTEQLIGMSLKSLG